MNGPRAIIADDERLMREQLRDRLRARLGADVKVETHVVSGEASDEILRAAETTQARLLVIGTHGRSGIGRWMYGSTASRLVREAAVPLVVVGPKKEPKLAAELRRRFQAFTRALAMAKTSAATAPRAKTIAKWAPKRLRVVRG